MLRNAQALRILPRATRGNAFLAVDVHFAVQNASDIEQSSMLNERSEFHYN